MKVEGWRSDWVLVGAGGGAGDLGFAGIGGAVLLCGAGSSLLMGGFGIFGGSREGCSWVEIRGSGSEINVP